MPRYLARATLTPELVADILSFRPSGNLLNILGWRRFELFSESLSETIAELVRFLLGRFIIFSNLQLLSQGLPEKRRALCPFSGLL